MCYRRVLRAVTNVLITMLFNTAPQSLQNLHVTRYSLENTKPMFQHPVFPPSSVCVY